MCKIVEEVVGADNFLRLREVTGLSPRPKAAAEKALPNSVYGVHITLNEKPIGMGRIVGDGALNFDIVDIAVEPEHQGNGLGRIIMEYIMGFLEKEALQGAYICLMVDVPKLYKKFGFKLTSQHNEGMYLAR